MDERQRAVDSATERLLLAPITYVRDLDVAAGAGDTDAAAAARRFCGQFGDLARKYPFARSAAPAAWDEIEAILRPGDGALWRMYRDHLLRYIEQKGRIFVPAYGMKPGLNPAFLSFFNEAANISTAFFGDGSESGIAFTIKPLLTPVVQSIALQIDGKVHDLDRTSDQLIRVRWSERSREPIRMTVTLSGGAKVIYPEYSGTWAVLHFFEDSENWRQDGSVYTLEKPLRETELGPSLRSGIRFAVDMQGAVPIFRPNYFRSLKLRTDIPKVIGLSEVA